MIGPHEATITRMVKDRSRSGYGYSPRIRKIFEFISNEEKERLNYRLGFAGFWAGVV